MLIFDKLTHSRANRAKKLTTYKVYTRHEPQGQFMNIFRNGLESFYEPADHNKLFERFKVEMKTNKATTTSTTVSQIR